MITAEEARKITDSKYLSQTLSYLDELVRESASKGSREIIVTSKELNNGIMDVIMEKGFNIEENYDNLIISW